MSPDKYALLEEKIRQTAILVGQLREENQRLVEENEQLRQHIAVLEEEARRSGPTAAEAAPDLDHLLTQLDTLHQTGPQAPTVHTADTCQPESTTRDVPVVEEEEPPAREEEPQDRESQDEEPRTAEEYFQLGKTYERRGQFEPAVRIYQQLLEADKNNLDVAQRLAFLLEKLNRDDEAAPLWDRIWRMRAGRSRRQRWSR